jgi:hypothetical protein
LVSVHADKQIKNNSFTIYIDPQNKNYDTPGKGVFKINIGGMSGMSMFEGNSGQWEIRSSKGIINDNSGEGADSYLRVIGIPWSMIGGKQTSGKRIGFNMALTDIDGHTENISANEADKPFTWCTLKLY